MTGFDKNRSIMVTGSIQLFSPPMALIHGIKDEDEWCEWFSKLKLAMCQTANGTGPF
jgi:hypothetical protein